MLAISFRIDAITSYLMDKKNVLKNPTKLSEWNMNALLKTIKNHVLHNYEKLYVLKLLRQLFKNI